MDLPITDELGDVRGLLVVTDQLTVMLKGVMTAIESGAGVPDSWEDEAAELMTKARRVTARVRSRLP